MGPNQELGVSGATAGQVASSSQPPGDEVVISGLSGRFPKSDDVPHFFENLNNKVDMVTTDNSRWGMDHPEMGKSTGKIDQLDKFDAQFFMVHYRQAWDMDPIARVLLETAYSAIYDAGVNPRTLRNKKIGVFIGAFFAESERVFFFDNVQQHNFGLAGCAKSMYSNRISYFLGTTGPSYTLDGATSSTALALEHGYRAIRTGQCDAAVVGGGYAFFHPHTLLQFHRLGFMSNGHNTRTFDKNSDGHAAADAVGVVFLQKAKDANRIYCEMVHAMADSRGAGEFDFLKRPARDIVSFLNDFYSLTGVSPGKVNYVEAYGFGVPEMDKCELEALETVFCKDRKSPLMVGAVTSNMGYSYPASGIVGLTKILSAYHTGKVSGNLHLEEPHSVQALKDGRMRILTETTAFPGGYAALNSFSFSGINVHILLKEFTTRQLTREKCEIPWLVTASGRTNASVENLFKKLLAQTVDPRQIWLIQNIHENQINGHMTRGYLLMNEKVTEEGSTNESVVLSQDYYDGDTSRPMWFVYSGMGSQWPAMAAHLMAIPIFREAIMRCHEILKPKGLDLIHILTDPDPKIFDNILHSFVGITAVQIGLTDLLWALDIQPDNIIGHSAGEVACGYADGCLTAEETILSAYYRGLISLETPFVVGSMAAVGIGHKQVEGLKPPNIDVACHNGPDSCTISGPAEDMSEFVAHLTSRGIFAREVPCSNIAFHSRYVADAGPGLLKYLTDVIRDPKVRTSRWVSTSVLQKRWQETNARMSSAEYYTNNLLSPVLFDEASRLIPENAITIEIAPHGLLQAILRRSLDEECINIPLTKRGHKNNAEFFLDAIGKLYQVGLNPKLTNIYPRIPLPVPAQTKTLSQLVEWEHSETWTLNYYTPTVKMNSGERFFSMSLYDEGYEYLSGCVIDGVNVFPEAAQLVLVWETLGMIVGIHYTQLSVVFSDVHFKTEIVIKKNSTLEMSVMIQRGSGKFELILNDSIVSSGQINIVPNNSFKNLEAIVPEPVSLNQRDIYQMLRTKGFNYSGEFQSLKKTDINFETAKVTWRNNWVTFLDSIVQLNHLNQDYGDITRVRYINRIAINTRKHQRQLADSRDISIERHSVCGIIRSAGVEVKDIVAVKELKKRIPKAIIHMKEFVPFFNFETNAKATDALQGIIEIALENTTNAMIKIVDLTLEDSLLEIIGSLFIPQINIEFERTTKNKITLEPKLIRNADLLVVPENYNNNNILLVLETELKARAFVILIQNKEYNSKLWPSFDMIASTEITGVNIILIRKIPEKFPIYAIVQVAVNASLRKVETEVDNIIKSGQKAVIISENLDNLDKIDSMRRSKNGEVSIILVDRQNIKRFSIQEHDILAQIQKGLGINVFKNGVWGSYRKKWVIPKYVAPEHVQLTVAEPGSLKSLTWTETSPPKGHLLVLVNYAHVTSSDVKKIIDVTDEERNHDHGLGMSFAGRTFSGERVMGIACGGALRSVACAHPDLVWPVPAHWSLEDAATVPQPYVFAYYALVIKGSLRRGFRVLVHEGLTPLGQAAINICVAAECEIFTTVSDLSQKQLLLQLNPKLKGSHVCSSRDDSFELVVNTLTEGEGCNVVLNTLHGSSRKASLRCVSTLGTSVDINVEEVFEFGMKNLSCERQYTTANFSNVLAGGKKDIIMRKKLREFILTGISEGTVKPLTRIVFEPREASRACHLIAAGQERAAILLNITPSSVTHRLAVTPMLTMPPTQTCLLVSLDHDPVLGLELLDRILQAGAKHILFNSITPLSKEFMAKKMRACKDSGISLESSSVDLSSVEQCRQLLVLARKPLACVIVAGLETDAATATTFMDNLHLVSTTICPQIQQFVFIGREGAIRTTEKRLKQGLPMITLQLTEAKVRSDNDIARKMPSKQEISVILNTLENLLATTRHGYYTCSLAEDVDGPDLFMENLESILGTAILKHHNESLTLEDLSVTEKMAQQIEILMNFFYKQPISHLKLLKKNMKEFRELLDTLGRKQQRLRGLRMFLTQLAKDEFKAAEPYVLMPTLISDGNETEDTFERREDYLVVVPGFEGHHMAMLELCKRLKLRTFVHQLPLDHHDDDLKRIAQRMLKHIKMRLHPGARFHLVGYSFGAGVALAIARMLEEQGHEGKVFCIDGSPEMIKTLIQEEVGDIGNNELESRVKSEVETLVAEEMQKSSDAGFSKDYLDNVIKSVTLRFKAAIKSCEWTKQIKSQIILVRASESADNLKLSHDYGLQTVSAVPIRVYDLDANHTSCLIHPKLCDIINRELDSTIKEIFNKKNLCERYFVRVTQ